MKLNSVIEVKTLFPHEKEKEFEDQFSDWSSINEWGNIFPEDLKLRQIGAGGDRIIYSTKHPLIILKAGFGPQEMNIPFNFDFLYTPVIEFEFPVPLQDPHFQDGRPFGQFQQKIVPYQVTQQLYMPTRKKHREILKLGCDVGFAIEFIRQHSEEMFFDWVAGVQKVSGRFPSSQNWGWKDGKIQIFDYGRIIER